jgi:3-deoxy-D-manno-octulosonic-acid transferase
LEQRLAQQQVTVTRWSRRDLSIPPSIPYGVLLIDQVGVLADLYRLGAVAFVGGSFKDKVHSVMEPLACGCFVVTGPKINNNREALLFKNISVENLTAVTVVNNSDEFTMALNKIHNDLTSNDTKNSNLVNTQPNTNQDKHVIKYDLKKKLQEKVQSKQGASSKVLAWIERNQNLS